MGNMSPEVYDKLQPHEQRVVDERNEVAERKEKLAAYMRTPNYELERPSEQTDKTNQLSAMTAYISVLESRIRRFVTELDPLGKFSERLKEPLKVVGEENISDKNIPKGEPLFGSLKEQEKSSQREEQKGEDRLVSDFEKAIDQAADSHRDTDRKPTPMEEMKSKLEEMFPGAIVIGAELGMPGVDYEQLSQLSEVEERKKELKELKKAAKPLIKYLAKNYCPHTTAIVTNNRCEITQGVKVLTTDKYIKD